MILRIKKTEIDWQDGSLYSKNFEDRYFSRSGGIAESTHVYLKSNGLPERWLKKEEFWIGELGFGTALNFCITYQNWIRTPGKHLHYVSAESHPLTREQLKFSLAHFPELENEISLLLKNYPVSPVAGIHRIELPHSVTLHLLFGDAHEAYSQWVLPPEFDGLHAWYVDGFKPSKNESLWTQDLFRLLAGLSAKGATLASYSVATHFREKLREAGFEAEKIQGFGDKLQCLRAVLNTQPERLPPTPPWYSYPAIDPPFLKKASILGAGLSGSYLAHRLADQGWMVDIYEASGEIASGASGNPVGIFKPHLAATINDTSRYSLQAFQTFSTVFNRFPQIGAKCGVETFFKDNEDRERFRKGIEEHSVGLDYIQFREDSVFYPEAGWIRPRDLCKALLNHPAIHLHLNQPISAEEKSPGIWIDCTARNASHEFFHTQSIRGQMMGAEAWQLESAPEHIRSRCLYCTPPVDGKVYLGATFEPKNLSTEIDTSSLKKMIHESKTDLGLIWKNETPAFARVGFRCASPDKLPIAGALPDVSFYSENYSQLILGKAESQFLHARYQKGRYVMTGMGSRGITYAAKAAEVLSALLNRQPLPIDADLWSRIHPARFWIRKSRSQGIRA